MPVAPGVPDGWLSAALPVPQLVSEMVKQKVWVDTSFLTSTGLAAASRLPKTLDRGRSIFG